jgi:hypothetical protein
MTWRRGKLERRAGRCVVECSYENPAGFGLVPRVVEWHELTLTIPAELELELEGLELEQLAPGHWLGRLQNGQTRELRTRRRPLINPAGMV